MITVSEESADKRKQLEWVGYFFNISTGNWTKPNRRTITAHDFCFYTPESLEKIIMKEIRVNEKNDA